MKLFRKIIIKIIHSLEFDIVRIQNDYDNPFGGLTRFPIRTVIDIGANRGQFARKALKQFPKAHIYCFEPLLEPFEELQKLAGVERESKITVFNLALGDKEGENKMFLCLGHDDSSSLLKSTKTSEILYPFTKKQTQIPVRLATLDKVMGNLPELLTDILIKVDVEGYEDRVIYGGRKTFQKARACILEICLDKLYEDQATFSKISCFMDTLGFEYAGNLDQVYDKDGKIIYIDAVFVKSDVEKPEKQK